jgi:hypothetical protein
MKMSIETGGPAFPSMRDMRHNPDFDHEEGMSIRDYFAATAMQAWLSGWPSEAPHPASTDDKGARIAKLSYAMADAMIQARNMGNENEVK